MGHTPLGPLAFWEGFENELVTLAVYGLGLAIYAILVGTFYITLSRRNLADPSTHRTPGVGGFLLLLPLVSFGLFMVLALSLMFLAKSVPGLPEAQRVRDLLLLSMAVVAGVRVTAYMNELAAQDLAKLVPLGLLGVLLVDPGYVSPETPFQRLALLGGMADLVLRYLLAVIILEAVLRTIWVAIGGRARDRVRAHEARAPAARPFQRAAWAPAPRVEERPAEKPR